MSTGTDIQIVAPEGVSYDTLSMSPDGDYVYFCRSDNTTNNLNYPPRLIRGRFSTELPAARLRRARSRDTGVQSICSRRQQHSISPSSHCTSAITVKSVSRACNGSDRGLCNAKRGFPFSHGPDLDQVHRQAIRVSQPGGKSGDRGGDRQSPVGSFLSNIRRPNRGMTARKFLQSRRRRVHFSR